MSPSTLPPRSGQQYTISHGDYQAVITQLGASLRTLTYRGHDMIASWDPDGTVPCSNGQLLIPYPNRIADGVYTFESKTYELPIDEHERRNAIHGYGYRAFWNLERLEEDEAVLSWRTGDMLGYPFDLTVLADYRLCDEGLKVTISARNNDRVDAPWAVAMHPWIANGFGGYGDEIDGQNAQCEVTIPARTHVTVDERLLPTGTEPVDGTKFDFRKPKALTEQPFDDAWTDVEHDADGNAFATLTRPDGMTIHVGGDRTITSFQMCTGTHFAPENHPAGVAIEPQTAYANAFNSGRDLIVIKPGETSATTLYFRAEQR
ncbi:aldose 1-epimerase family protein [Bifidobacterium sp. ESL0763]|uniref:aldose 1-epimerase family protein n=1 Tax=Bifidobacterium sp. ESL0763 TaxID=2983227 RepID=UPI0023F9E1C5|nr:aldose 1-epimerase family protein [Bifidobacterium sp. ESL0763]MDF7664132.1 aldose 1-epimerase family protein [Bifidobacterium sp. ESL0763]